MGVGGARSGIGLVDSGLQFKQLVVELKRFLLNFTDGRVLICKRNNQVSMI